VLFKILNAFNTLQSHTEYKVIPELFNCCILKLFYAATSYERQQFC